MYSQDDTFGFSNDMNLAHESELQRLRNENERLKINVKNTKKIIMKTSHVMAAVEELQQKCDALEEENSKLKYQLYVKQLYDPKVVDKTIKSIYQGEDAASDVRPSPPESQDAEIDQFKKAHDKECGCEVFQKLKFVMEEAEFYKKQLNNKMVYDKDTIKHMKKLEKQNLIQEKQIAELRRAVSRYSQIRENDQEVIQSLTHLEREDS
ncbi:unnamed protein product [Moneuplotes crassus]|uniref:Uncharacterized protein n=1 Tax=Euplotes crassus TaxID=5936 RepID=A0AAD1XWH7_EUPCR|nr:unnamed protein product [Moneuplotes crassus]